MPATAKADGSFVTAADTAIEVALRAEIAAAYPDHAIVGEEQGGALVAGTPTWVIDPIDATANFLRGVPVFATLIALVQDGRTVLGVASAPALGECWDAAEGAGARRNGEPIGVSAVTELARAHVLHGDLDRFRAEPAMWDALTSLVDDAWRSRGFGDFWMHLLVAGGMAEAAVEQHLAVWDVAALDCIVREAGGRITGPRGVSVLANPGGWVLSTNGLLHDEISARLP